MNAKQKMEANEKREMIFVKSGWICGVCGKPLQEGCPQLAHRIANTKTNRKRYHLSDSVINYEMNLVPVCSLKCNDKCNIGNNPVKAYALIEEIKEAMLAE